MLYEFGRGVSDPHPIIVGYRICVTLAGAAAVIPIPLTAPHIAVAAYPIIAMRAAIVVSLGAALIVRLNDVPVMRVVGGLIRAQSGLLADDRIGQAGAYAGTLRRWGDGRRRRGGGVGTRGRGSGWRRSWSRRSGRVRGAPHYLDRVSGRHPDMLYEFGRGVSDPHPIIVGYRICVTLAGAAAVIPIPLTAPHIAVAAYPIIAMRAAIVVSLGAALIVRLNDVPVMRVVGGLIRAQSGLLADDRIGQAGAYAGTLRRWGDGRRRRGGGVGTRGRGSGWRRSWSRRSGRVRGAPHYLDRVSGRHPDMPYEFGRSVSDPYPIVVGYRVCVTFAGAAAVVPIPLPAPHIAMAAYPVIAMRAAIVVSLGAALIVSLNDVPVMGVVGGLVRAQSGLLADGRIGQAGANAWPLRRRRRGWRGRRWGARRRGRCRCLRRGCGLCAYGEVVCAYGKIADGAPQLHDSGSGDAARKIYALSVAARVGVVSLGGAIVAG